MRRVVDTIGSIAFLTVFFSLVVGLAVLVGQGSGDRGRDNTATPSADESPTLSVRFVADALASARLEQGDQAIRVTLNERGLDVEYAAADEAGTRSLVFDPSAEGFRIRVNDLAPGTPLPTTIPLDLVDPEEMVAALRDAVDAAGGASFYAASAGIGRDGSPSLEIKVLGEPSLDRSIPLGEGAQRSRGPAS